MRNLITVFILWLPIIFSAQNIIGKVIDIDDNAIQGVKVETNSSNKVVTTDESGNFQIQKSSDDTTIQFSRLGYRTKSIDIQTINDLGNIVLYEGVELFDIVVQGERANKFSRKETDYVGKMPLRDLENSQVYSTVTTELLESQMVTSLDGALRNASGIVKQWDATARNGDGTGYFALRGFSTKPDLVDGMPGYTFNNVDPSYIDRIEVLKGPSATLFGSTYDGLGGLINVVTKKTLQRFWW